MSSLSTVTTPFIGELLNSRTNMYQHSTLFWCSKQTRELLFMTLPMKEKKPRGLARVPQSPTSSKHRIAMQDCAPNVTAL